MLKKISSFVIITSLLGAFFEIDASGGPSSHAGAIIIPVNGIVSGYTGPVSPHQNDDTGRLIASSHYNMQNNLNRDVGNIYGVARTAFDNRNDWYRYLANRWFMPNYVFVSSADVENGQISAEEEQALREGKMVIREKRAVARTGNNPAQQQSVVQKLFVAVPNDERSSNQCSETVKNRVISAVKSAEKNAAELEKGARLGAMAGVVAGSVITSAVASACWWWNRKP